MHIYYGIPYALDKNLGAEYNRYMNLLPNDDDWMCVTDGDIMFFGDFGHQISDVIKKIPDAGLITCLTNRIAKNKAQLYGGDSSDAIVHRVIAKNLDKDFRGSYRKINQKVSGFFMAIKKKTWLEVGKFPEIPNKILDIDGLISSKILRSGKGIYLMRGVYVFHYYRLLEGVKYKDHLRNAEEIAKKSIPQRSITKSSRRNRTIINKRRRR